MAIAIVVTAPFHPARAASLVVTTTADSGPGSLRQALLDANVDGLLDTISFAISASGVPTIKLATALPSVTGPVTIDGTTQSPAGWVEIDGAATAAASGLTLAGGTSTVRGLVIGGFAHAAIVLSGPGGDVVEGCRLGTDATGTLGRSSLAYGVEVSSSPANRIGGTSSGSGNLLSGNLFGIFVHGSAAVGTVIEGNLIGTDPSGTAAVPNQTTGIWIFNAPQTVVGGTDPAAGNVVAGNGVDGIDVGGASATNTVIQGNAIGLGADLVTPIGNAQYGIYFSGSAGTATVGGAAANWIANSGGAGVELATGAGTRITISANVITGNGGLGIDLGAAGVTPNDAGDVDGGPNGQQNFPVLASIAPDGTSVSGTLDGASNASFTIEVFANAACDPSGNGEGDELVATQLVTTDGTGHAGFIATLSRAVDASSEHLTATATDALGSTSEFSACLPASASTTSSTSTTTTTSSTTTSSAPAPSTTTTTTLASTTTTTMALASTTTTTTAPVTTTSSTTSTSDPATSTTSTTAAAASTTSTTAPPASTTSTTVDPSTTTSTTALASSTTSTSDPAASTTSTTAASASTTSTTAAPVSTTSTTVDPSTTTSTTVLASTTTSTSDPAASTTSTTAAPASTTSTTAVPVSTTSTTVDPSTTTSTTVEAPTSTTSTTLPAASTTSTTAPVRTTTSSTTSTLPGCVGSACDPGCSVEATFDSIRCRLDRLGITVDASADLGAMRGRIDDHVARAERLLGASDDRCAAAKRGPARRSLRMVGRHLGRVRRMLAHDAREAPTPTIESLSGDTVALRADTRTLVHDLVCP